MVLCEYDAGPAVFNDLFGGYMKVLIACEESQAVCKEMRRLGHESYSADLQNCSGGHPEWHVKGDVLPLINGRCSFTTCDGTHHEISVVTALENRIKARGVFLVFKNAKTGKIPREPP